MRGFDSRSGLLKSCYTNSKMRKIALLFALLILLTAVIFAPIRSHAQEFNAQKAFQDYQFQLTAYGEAEARYEEAKGFYLKNPTLQIREDARQKTLAFLKVRDQLLATYLTAVRMQLAETRGLSEEEKGGTFGKIDPEVAWYQNHLKSYQDGDELATLFSKSDESKNRYNSTTKLIAFEALFNISLSQEIDIRQNHQLVYADLKSYINDQVAAGKLRIDPFNRWLNDTDAVLITLSQNEDTARRKISTLYAKNYDQTKSYNTAIQVLSGSISPLSQLNNYLTELLASIENQQQ